jgi:ankyrin repeat protein
MELPDWAMRRDIPADWADDAALAAALRGGDVTALLHEAAGAGNEGKCRKLVQQEGADVNAGDMIQVTPMHTAAEGGHTSTCKALVEMGADVNARNEGQRTPVHFAAGEGHTGACKALVEMGALMARMWTQGMGIRTRLCTGQREKAMRLQV